MDDLKEMTKNLPSDTIMKCYQNVFFSSSTWTNLTIFNHNLLPWYHDKIKYDPSKSKRYTEDLPQLDEDPLLEAASELSGTELAGASLTEQLELLENLRNESPEVFTSDLEMTDSSYEGYRHFCSLPGRLYPLTGSKTNRRKNWNTLF